MKELICNLHIHSTYSDGSGDYPSIAKAALQTNVDVIILTDHNVLVKGLEGYREGNGRKVLVLTGEEVHDQNRDPQKNHTLVFNTNRDMATYASDPQTLIHEIKKAGGLSFLAHPYEFALPMIGEPNISWVSWDVEGFTGLELWNGLSEFKTVTHNVMDGLKYLFMPELMAHGPLPDTLKKWDDLLTEGKKVVAVTGSDSHAIKFHKGPLKRTVFPYEFHFSAINNHLWIDEDLTGDLEHDKTLVYQSLKRGASFIGYDLPASTNGFRFIAENENGIFYPGDTVKLDPGATVKVSLPEQADIRLVHNGKTLIEQKNSDRLSFTISESGYYRVECSIYFLNKQRGWIFSNPIYAISAKEKKAR